MKFSALLDVDVVAVESEDEVSVLLDLTAPPAPESAGERTVSCLQVVLDVSGSMAGERLDGAKRALLTLVDRLDSRDTFGLVVFDDTASIAVPAGPLSDKAAVKRRIAQVHSGGMTNLCAGYLRGLQETSRVGVGSGATLLLISDGHANSGVTDPAALGGIARKGAADGVVTSTLGYGLGYDETVLAEIAAQGVGNHHFAEDPDTAGHLIATEVDGLVSKTVTATSLTIELSSDVSIVRLYNDLPSVQLADGSVLLELGDFYAEEERRLLMTFAVPAMAGIGASQVATMTLQYVELPHLVQQTITLPIAVNVVPGDEAAGRVAEPTVRSEVAFQEAQRRVLSASEAIGKGDASTARRCFDEAQALLDDVPVGLSAEVTAELENEKAKLRHLAERTHWDDPSRLSKESRASSFAETRQRGRQRGPGRGGRRPEA